MRIFTKNLILALSIFITSISFIDTANASHISGGDFSYTCVGPNQYFITLNLYYDCSASLTPPSPSLNINFANSCGVANPPSLALTLQNPGGTEISQLCPAQQGNSTCNNGTLPGMSVWTYTGIVTLPANCNYTMSYSLCCRNVAVNVTNSTSANFFVTANIDNTTNNCNNSPQFTSQPIPYVCINQPVTYNFGAIEPDGDSLVFSLVSSRSALTTNVTYAGGYSATQPIPGASITSNTGQLTFTPTTLGFFIFVIRVDEYDDNGNFLGSVSRDIQFVVQNCNNNAIDISSGPIDNFSGTAQQTGPFSIGMCEGDNFIFEATFTDVDTLDSLSFTSNINAVLPGATIVRNPASTGNNLILTISWSAPAGSAGLNNSFVIEASDNACTVPSLFSVIYSINVIQSTVITPTRFTICGDQTSTLNATGGTIFGWAILDGGNAVPVFPNAEFSCNPCASPVVKPLVTTTYIVVSDLSVGCVNTDTVTINVVPDFIPEIVSDKDSICLNDFIQYNIITNEPGFNYSYQWTPSTFLDDATISNPLGTYTTGGTYTYIATITSLPGCEKKDTVEVRVSPNLPPNISLEYIPICYDDSVQLYVDFGFVVPSTCGPSTTTCTSNPDSLLAVGDGISTSTLAYPTPFMGFWEDGRIQMLITAAELNALGFNGGVLSEFAINVLTKGSTQAYNGFNVKIACTSLSALSNAAGFVSSGFTTVHTSTFNTVVGWNTIPFNISNYDWDGTSNLLVEFCFDNSSWTGNDVVQKATTSFTSSIHRFQDGASGCSLISNAQNNLRPLLRIKYCEGADPNNYGYTWTPSNLLSDSNIYNPLGLQSLPGPNVYSVIVRDIIGGCADTATASVIPVTSYDLTITPVPTQCSVGAPVQLTAATPGGTWSASPNANSIDTNTGIFNPALAINGTNTISYTVTGACGGTSTTTIEVVTLPNTAIDPVTTLCSDDPFYTMTAASPNGTWSSLPNANAINPTTGLFNPDLAANGNNTIRYVISIGACADSSQITVVVQARANATITSSIDTLCENSANTIITTAQTGGTWTASPVAGAINNTGLFRPTIAGPGLHTLTYTIGGACGASSTKDIYIISPQNIVINPVDPICVDADAITVVSNLPGGQWSAAPVTGAINQTTGVFNPQTAGVGNHTITYTVNVGPCVFSNNIIIVVKPTPNSPLVNLPLAPCIGETYEPITATSPSGGFFVWYSDEGLQNVLDTSATIEFTGTNTDTLYVVNILNGCNGPAREVALPFNGLPSISFTATPEFGAAALTVTFTNTSDSISDLTFEWEYDSMVFSTIENPTEVFVNPGTYTVTLTGTDLNGCENTFQKDITVDFIVPNVFSPNGDGKNDKFFDISQTTININDFEAKIFNRWGSVVYEWSDKNGWNGNTNGGSAAAAGVYFYIMTGKRDNGEVFQREGNVTLLR
jgi:gliding motility-associated-like protein